MRPGPVKTGWRAGAAGSYKSHVRQQKARFPTRIHQPEPPKPPPFVKKVEEIGGPPGPEPTRYGDWQFNGKVTDF